jgi:hydroxymethylcytosylglucuronate/cytosylglucuronate synthase
MCDCMSHGWCHMSSLTLLVATANFGLGSAGKLASILDELPEDVDLVVHGSELGAGVWSSAANRVVRCVPSSTPVREVLGRDVDIALAILAADTANDLLDIGVPVIYVDSLPFLWTPHDAVPVRATKYLAQQTMALPSTCWPVIRSIERLEWVGAIVPKGFRWTGHSGGVVVNLGGLTSWVRRAEDISYPAAVLPSVVDAVRRSCGDVPITITTSADAVASVALTLDSRFVDIRVEALNHEDFLSLACASSLMISSPGLTTIFEAGAFGIPTVVLPPQNLSQFRNAEAFGVVAPMRVVGWPTSTLGLAAIDAVAADGEDAAVRYIYAQIDAAIGDPEIARRLSEHVSSAIETDSRASPGTALLDVIGLDGSRQVAEALMDAAIK